MAMRMYGYVRRLLPLIGGREGGFPFLWFCDLLITGGGGGTPFCGLVTIQLLSLKVIQQARGSENLFLPRFTVDCYIKLLRCNKICLFNKSQPCANNLYLICFLYPYDT